MTKTRWKVGGGGGEGTSKVAANEIGLCLSLGPPRVSPPQAPRPWPRPGAPVMLTAVFGPAQAQRITAAGSAVPASWTSCALRAAAVRVPSWTAPTRSWPASQATSPNTSLTCKYYLRSRTHPVTPSQPEQGLWEAAPPGSVIRMLLGWPPRPQRRI